MKNKGETMITIDGNTYHLQGDAYSYCFYVKNGKLLHGYYGQRLEKFVAVCDAPMDDFAAYEYGEFGRGDFRSPSIVVRDNGGIATDFQFVSHEILAIKPRIGMPQLRGEHQTLAVYLRDEKRGIKLTLFYTPLSQGLCRSAAIENESAESVFVDKFLSTCVDFPSGEYDILHLSGRPNKERDIVRERVSEGIKTISSTRGTTSHEHNCFCALLQPEANEEYGNAYGFNLIYSGNFAIETEKDALGQIRLNAGEQILYGGWELNAGERIYTPEVVCVYSAKGIGEMSRQFHTLYRKHLLDPRFVDKIRPIVINSWESVVYDVCEETMFRFIENAKGLGIDTVVLDDGWFGKRDNDDCSLGDWVVDKRKLPNGLQAIIRKCKENGMKFGLWFEPEMVSPDSDLNRLHPDWVLQSCHRESVQFRNQWVLDFSKKEVVDYVFASMKKVLDENDISYVKWDMNRPLTDVLNAKKYRAYMLGVYDLYERLTTSFPNLFIEGCSSGGGRFDPAILYYSPMIWTSDNTDAWSRTMIQHSTSLCYPLQSMSNHVSACPNIQTGRTISFATRGTVAMMGCLGYELHVENEEERVAVRMQTATYQKDADVILTGDLYRLKNPFTDGAFAQIVVSEDKQKAVFCYVRKDSEPTRGKIVERVCLRGLGEDVLYKAEETGEIQTGKTWMCVGVQLRLEKSDYACASLHFSAV
ncbi:MAG: alpha-galactosidase [Clostridiales bacterium]|nr:alpha-galactosidase [Clostridiales bacterium]